MKASRGFSVVELMVAIVFLGVVGTVIYEQQGALRSIHRDQSRKVAMNEIYYNLEEVVKPKLGGYPRLLTAAQLTAMDKRYLKDPAGVLVGASDSQYRYEPTGCNGGDVCRGYTLRADLEREADFVRSSGLRS